MRIFNCFKKKKSVTTWCSGETVKVSLCDMIIFNVLGLMRFNLVDNFYIYDLTIIKQNCQPTFLGPLGMK